MKQLTEIDYPLSNIQLAILSKIVVLDEGHIDFKLYKKDSVDELSVSAYFDPNTYAEEVGSITTPVYTILKDGTKVEWKPFFNRRIENFLESQGPGSTDLYIPFVTELDGKCYVLTCDGACGDSLIEFDKGKYKKSEICKLMIDYHLDEEDEDEDNY